MTRRDRFRLKSQLVMELESGRWEWDQTNLLFAEFGIPTRSDNWHDPPLGEFLADVGDEDLVELTSIVLEIDPSEVLASVESAPGSDGNWKPGYLRVFLSHSAVRKAEVTEIADELAVVGIHGFVAHETMEVSKPWQAQIEAALRSMQALVALVHPELNESAWCHQEIGWALGRRVPTFAVRVGDDPKGFLGSSQWPSVANGNPKSIAQHISTWISGVPELGEQVVDSLIRSLGEAGNYYSAEAAAERIAALGTLTEHQFEQLSEVWWSNDQLYGGYLPTQVMQPFFANNGRQWPPPKPVDPADEDPF